jgi:hypothetical protein
METGKVFISSILNLAIEDLRAERLAVKEVVEDFGFLHAWAFEAAPASTEELDQSFLRHVDECDLFILIIGAEMTKPVNSEWLRAKRTRKPILVFAKSCSERSTEVEVALEALGRKYATFSSPDSLKDATRRAITDTVVLALRTFRMTRATPSVEEQLGDLAANNSRVRVSPTMPAGSKHDFFVEKVESGKVHLQKVSNQQRLEIPVTRVREVLPQTDADIPLLTLAGRVQWITASQRWKFLSEPLPVGSLFGIGKLSHPGDPQIVEIRQQIGPLGFPDFCWDWESNVSDRLAYGWEVFYDDDGNYLRYVVAPSEQIFFVKKARV